MSNVCPTFVQARNTVIYSYFTGNVIAQMLDFCKSRVCPTFVQAQGDKMADGKNSSPVFYHLLSSNFLVHLGQVTGQKEDKCWIRRTNIRFGKDKSLILKANTGHTLDKDIY